MIVTNASDAENYIGKLSSPQRGQAPFFTSPKNEEVIGVSLRSMKKN
jgi:hypothetical protein